MNFVVSDNYRIMLQIIVPLWFVITLGFNVPVIGVKFCIFDAPVIGVNFVYRLFS